MVFLSLGKPSLPLEGSSAYHFDDESSCKSTCDPHSYELAVTSWSGVDGSIKGLTADPSDKCDASQPTAHCCGKPFDINAFSQSTQQRMFSKWHGDVISAASCGGFEGVQGAWCQAWSTHGVCSGLDQDAFFTKALDLYEEYNKKVNSNDCSSFDCVSGICFSDKFEYEGTAEYKHCGECVSHHDCANK